MALRIPVQKDIGEYEEKIVSGLTLRTMCCLALAFSASAGVAAFTYFVVGASVEAAVYPMFLVAVPFMAVGFWKPFGLKLEQFAPLFARHVLEPQVLTYEPCTKPAMAESGPVPGEMTKKAAKAVWRKGAELYEPEEAEAGR